MRPKWVRGPTTLLVVLPIFSAATPLPGQPSIIVKNARVSWPGTGAHTFWQIASSPTNPENLVVCSLRSSGRTAHALEAVIYGSTDAGESWTVLKSEPNFPENGEVTCGMSDDEVVYFGQTVFHPQPEKSAMYLWRSPDFGATWKLSPHIPLSDAALLLVKKNAMGRDRVFNLANTDGRRSDRYLTIFDNDATEILKIPSWNPAPNVNPIPNGWHCARAPGKSTELFNTAALPGRTGACITGVTTMMSPLDLGNGLLGSLFLEFTLDSKIQQQLTFSRFSDDGQAYGEPVAITPIGTRWKELNALNDGFVLFIQPGAAVGKVPGTDRTRIYVAWQDFFDGRVRVLLSRSDDFGSTWTMPSPIDDRAKDMSHPRPAAVSVAVNKDGLVGVSWVEFSGRCWRIAFSSDGGSSFAASAPINRCDPDSKLMMNDALASHIYPVSGGRLRFDAAAKAGFTLHESGITLFDFRAYLQPTIRGTSLTAAADGSFYMSWAALGTQHDELHSAHLSFQGQGSSSAVRRNRIIGAARCCLLPRGDTELYYTSFDYDPTTQEFEIGAFIARKRSSGSEWPLVVRLDGIDSVLGPIHASNADNDMQGPGAAWVFDGPGRQLPPSSGFGNVSLLPADHFEYSVVRTLRFKVEGELKEMLWRRVLKDESGIPAADLANIALSLLAASE